MAIAKKSSSQSRVPDPMSKVAVFFHYFEASKRYRENLVFFLAQAYRKELTYYIIISGGCSVDIPRRSNINVIYVENKNYDYGGYATVLQAIQSKIDQFDLFIFVNSSARGPFSDKNSTEQWYERFSSKMVGDIHLVGSSINIISVDTAHSARFRRRYNYPEPYSHVQTTAYALTQRALRHLLEIGFYGLEETITKDEVICEYELRLSQEIKKAGWNMAALLEKYNGIDYRRHHGNHNYSTRGGGPLNKGAYFGSSAQPNELMFVKTNRSIFPRFKRGVYTYNSIRNINDDEFRNWHEVLALRRQAILDIVMSPAFFVYHRIRRFIVLFKAP